MKKKAPTKSKIKRKGNEGFHGYGPALTEVDIRDILNEDLMDAFSKLRAFARDLGEQRIYSSHKAVMFARKVCYFFVRPKKAFVEVCIFLPEEKTSPAVRKVHRHSKTKFAHMLRLEHADQVEEPLTDWVRQAYECCPA